MPPGTMPENLASLDNGRYQLQEILGQGGMAVVYKAWDSRLRVERAIKILSPQVARRASLRKRFENEARTMARLAHPNIVSVTDVIQESDRFFMVMELVTGGTLWDWVTTHGRMPSRLALEHLVPVLDAMGAAHAAGVIHRDIKPQNIMLTAEGQPKVTDFGIAHVQDLLNTSSLTRTGSVMGTWGYMAPEQRQSARDVDGRSDVYALGATLYAVVTADLPVDLFAAAQDEDVLGRVPEELHLLVRKATRYRADDRYQDVHEMAAACATILHDLPKLPQGTPRSGSDPELQPARRPVHAVPFAPTDTAQAASQPNPAERETPIPLRTLQISDETFDFGHDSVLDPDPPAPAGVIDTLADTPLHPQRHTAVPEIVTTDPPSDTEPEPEQSAKARWPRPLLAALIGATIGLPALWFGLRPPGVSETEPVAAQPDGVSPKLEAPLEPAPSAAPEPAERLDAAAPEPSSVQPAHASPTPAGAQVERRATPTAPPASTTLEPDAPPAAAKEQPRAIAAPVPEPEAVAAPEPLAVAAPEPTASPEPAHLSVQGEVDELRLIDGGGKAWPPGDLPPGSYKIEALFPGGSDLIVAGKVDLAPGQSHTLSCNAAFKKCR